MRGSLPFDTHPYELTIDRPSPQHIVKADSIAGLVTY